MSKTKKATKRKRDALQEKPNKKPSRPQPTQTLSPPLSDSADGAEHGKHTLSAVVSAEEIEVTVDTLRTLAKNPASIKTKACKDLRTAVYDFRQACTTGLNTSGDANLTAKVSAALADGKYLDAIVSLAEMRIRNETPKLGALCRWVRDLDVTSGLSQTSGSGAKSRPELLRVMDSILRVSDPIDYKSGIPPTPLDPADHIAMQPTWEVSNRPSEQVQMRAAVLDGSLASCLAGLNQKFTVLERTPGPQRRPPNLHEAVLYLSDDDSVPLSSTPPPTTLERHPIVPNLSLMRDALTTDECKTIVASMEKIGFLPDSPLRDDGSDSSILAHNVYWIVDQSFHDKLWERVRRFVPAEVGGRKARGINRRFRVYRYVPGAEYRVHFDGAWPPSGVHPETGKYMWDSSPAAAKQSSMYTFLVYLNDEFEGGETTFFTPSVREGVMNAHRVRPLMGAIALFPHGEGNGALLHEGTGVRKGAKYIMRTDVEYDVEPGRDN